MHRHCKNMEIGCVPFNLTRGMGMDPYGEVEHPMGG